ncbi:MAG: hypothetical protein GTO02_17585 [Candidatus Dadabacteria bacterium]|nr:hypothetical protein [Candidatus Dadabacteria bacterium]NIQ16131.1 hypothetical protein [Candidatus Dadabacteria bacterium]
MLNKIRSDIKKSFSKTKYLLVNSNIFFYGSTNGDNSDSSWKLNFESLIVNLKNLDIEIIFYNFDKNRCLLIQHNFTKIKQNGHLVFSKNEFKEHEYYKKKYIVIASDISDKKLINSSLFSITPFSVDLNVKMISSYVSNFDAEDVFVEVGNLIYNSIN